MKADEITNAELLAYADEQLPAARLIELEKLIRETPELQQRLATLLAERDAGTLSLGQVWRQRRLSCPSTEQLQQFLQQALSPEWTDYIRFHLETVGCAYCEAELEYLRSRTRQDEQQAGLRRRKIFESSAGYFKK